MLIHGYYKPKLFFHESVTYRHRKTGMRGFGLKLLHTNASEIEPWLVLPTHVSCNSDVRVSDVYCNMEFGIIDDDNDTSDGENNAQESRSTSGIRKKDHCSAIYIQQNIYEMAN